jgi:F-box domain
MSQLPASNQYMPRSDIPVDVLRDILEHVGQADLATMCRVSKIFYAYSQNVLYRDITCFTTNYKRIYRTLAQSTRLARKVLSFDSRLYSRKYQAMALRNMTSLRNLTLQNVFDMDIFDGCTFELVSFDGTYSSHFDGSFRKFISSQPSLKYVTLVSHDHPLSSLEATCLPNLTRITTTFPWIRYLIPGRPLNEVISYDHTVNEDSIDLSFFALSTAPIQKLTIDYTYLYPTPIRVLASSLPSLTHFTLELCDNVTFFENEGVRGLPLYKFSDIEQHGIG